MNNNIIRLDDTQVVKISKHKCFINGSYVYKTTILAKITKELANSFSLGNKEHVVLSNKEYEMYIDSVYVFNDAAFINFIEI